MGKAKKEKKKDEEISRHQFGRLASLSSKSRAQSAGWRSPRVRKTLDVKSKAQPGIGRKCTEDPENTRTGKGGGDQLVGKRGCLKAIEGEGGKDSTGKSPREK